MTEAPAPKLQACPRRRDDAVSHTQPPTRRPPHDGAAASHAVQLQLQLQMLARLPMAPAVALATMMPRQPPLRLHAGAHQCLVRGSSTNSLWLLVWLTVGAIGADRNDHSE